MASEYQGSVEQQTCLSPSHKPQRDTEPISFNVVVTRSNPAYFTSSPNSTFQYAKSRKCFQLSWATVLMVTFTNGRHFGRLGFLMRCMPAWVGVRLALRVLHGMHAQTMFSHVVVPPWSRGTMWSRFNSRRSKCLPQYWHMLWSRSKILCRVNFTSLCGSRSKNSNMITRGMRILNETVWTTSSPWCPWLNSRHSWKSKVWKFPLSSVTTSAWPMYRSINARSTVQTLIACHRRLSTNTFSFSTFLMADSQRVASPYRDTLA